MMDFFDKLDIAWIFGGILVACFAGGITAFIALFGWSLAKTFKNAKDLHGAHSKIRDLNGRIERIESFINGGLRSGQKHSSKQDVLDRSNHGPCSIVPAGPDVDY